LLPTIYKLTVLYIEWINEFNIEKYIFNSIQ